VPLHPVQLYESAACFALFILLAWMSRRKRFDGQVFLSYALLYAAARFTIEFFRGDADRGFVFGGLLSTSQFIALAVGAASAALFARRLLSCGPALRGEFSPSGGSTREAAPGGAD
jgi:phosphatidylglycerol---prolipoprotein diacylglyceryl transferase